MTPKSYFTLSPEERVDMNQRMLEARQSQLRGCAECLLEIDELDGDTEAEVLAEIVEAALDAYMRISKRNRPEQEQWMMTHLALERIKIRRTIRNEFE